MSPITAVDSLISMADKAFQRKKVNIDRVGEMSVEGARSNASNLSRQFKTIEFEKLAQKEHGYNSTA